MRPVNRLLAAATASVGFGFILIPVTAEEADPEPIPGYTRTHESTAVLDPEGPDSEDREGNAGGERFRVIRDEIDSPEWLDAIKKARRHVGGRGRYTLMRLILEDARECEQVQAQATKLKELTAEYHGGGGEYFVVPSGGFLFFEHINTSERRNGRDPVLVGSVSHGTTRLWVDVPPEGELGLLGDVVLRRPEDVGLLAIEIDAPPGVETTKIAIGPVVVGGSYGTTLPLDAEGRIELPLSPGTYKLLLPDFDTRRDRWDIDVATGTTTHLRFAAVSQNDVRKAGERREPYPFPAGE